VGDFGRELKALLRQGGCYRVREGKGSHEIWYSPKTDRNFTVVCNCKVRHTANAILAQAGLPKGF
jgi:predicted RNA binding protein YcfA (HicA-like mRNA interferase family)